MRAPSFTGIDFDDVDAEEHERLRPGYAPHRAKPKRGLTPAVFQSISALMPSPTTRSMLAALALTVLTLPDGLVVEASPAPLVFTKVRVFDGDRVAEGQTVVVTDGLIRSVSAEPPEVPAGATVIDGSGKTLLPGLIDAHGHVQKEEHLRQALVFGVTTVLDMFMQVDLASSLRGPAQGRANLADFRSSVTLVTAPGGHGTEYGFVIPTISSPAEAQAFVDDRIAEGSDFIKVVFDDGSAYGVDFPTLDRETIKAVIDAAHARGKLAVVHIGTQDDARAAIASGADGLMHTFVNQAPEDGTIKLAKEKGAFVVPTLSVVNVVAGKDVSQPLLQTPGFQPYLSPTDRDQLASRFTRSRAPATAGEWAGQTVRQLAAAGVPILAGSDAPNPGTLHGASLHGELELLVKAGLTPIQALAAATSIPARSFKLDDRGKIAPGKRADLVLVEGDPSKDITATRHIVGIWKRGAPVDRANYAAAIAKAKTDTQAGLVSDFEDGTTRTSFGFGWIISTDRLARGRSTAEMKVEPEGFDGSKHALRVAGAVDRDLAWPWAGVTFAPGPRVLAPADLSSRRQISFAARGDGKDYVIMVFSADRGAQGLVNPFTAGPEWGRHIFPIAGFSGIDGSDVTGIFIGATYPGEFSFAIDDVRIE